MKFSRQILLIFFLLPISAISSDFDDTLYFEKIKKIDLVDRELMMKKLKRLTEEPYNGEDIDAVTLIVLSSIAGSDKVEKERRDNALEILKYQADKKNNSIAQLSIATQYYEHKNEIVSKKEGGEYLQKAISNNSTMAMEIWIQHHVKETKDIKKAVNFISDKYEETKFPAYTRFICELKYSKLEDYSSLTEDWCYKSYQSGKIDDLFRVAYIQSRSERKDDKIKSLNNYQELIIINEKNNKSSGNEYANMAYIHNEMKNHVKAYELLSKAVSFGYETNLLEKYKIASENQNLNISDISYFDIFNGYNSKTTIQFENYKSSILYKKVRWKGKISDVIKPSLIFKAAYGASDSTIYKNSLSNSLEVIVNLEEKNGSGKVSFLLKENKAINLGKNEDVEFIGQLSHISPGFMGLNVILSDMKIFSP